MSTDETIERLMRLSRDVLWSPADFEFWKANTNLPIVGKWVRDDVPDHVEATPFTVPKAAQEGER